MGAYVCVRAGAQRVRSAEKKKKSERDGRTPMDTERAESVCVSGVCASPVCASAVCASGVCCVAARSV